MKLIWKYLIPAYYTALSGHITVNGSILPVYDGMVPANGANSYILIGERTTTQLHAKNDFTSECYILIDVVLKGNDTGYADSEEAADQILAIINSDANPQPSSGFKVVTTSVQSVNNMSGLSAMDNIFRTLIRFRHTVVQS